MLQQEGGPTISEGVQIFLKYEVRGSKYFEIFGPGGSKVGGGGGGGGSPNLS